MLFELFLVINKGEFTMMDKAKTPFIFWSDSAYKPLVSIRKFLILLGLLLGFQISTSAFAFDAGHHYDLSFDAATHQGLNESTALIIAFDNLLVDYYTSQPLLGLGKELDKLHFDNLVTTDLVRTYWSRLTINTKSAVQEAARENNPRKIMALIGYSLHAVQDFYTHSNWADLLTAGDYLQASTYFNTPISAKETRLRTGKYPNSSPVVATDHGTDGVGINHDFYGRPNWINAYTTAYSASREWINAIQNWVFEVDRNIWAKVQNPTIDAIDYTFTILQNQLMYDLTSWFGHWKGPTSKHLPSFALATAKFLASRETSATLAFKAPLSWYYKLTFDLEKTEKVTAAVPQIPRIELRKNAVIIKTNAISEDKTGTFETKIDPAGTADFYAKITVDGRKYIEAVEQNRNPVIPNWTTVAFVDDNRTTASIKYELWDQDEPENNDDHCDINPNTGYDLSITYNINGQAAINGKGNEKDRANLAAVVTTKRMVRLEQFPAQPPVSMAFEQMPGAATDVGIGANNSVWVVGMDKAVYNWTGTTWNRIESSEITRVAVDPQGNPWVIGGGGNMFRRVNNAWVSVPGQALDIGIGADGTVYHVGLSNTLYKWNGSGWSNSFGSGAAQVAVDPQGNAWTVDTNGVIAKYNGTVKTILPGAAKDIAISANGIVFVVGTDNAVYTLTAGNWVNISGNNGAVRIGADAQGFAWIVTNTNVIGRGF
jgi:Tectonin domain